MIDIFDKEIDVFSKKRDNMNEQIALVTSIYRCVTNWLCVINISRFHVCVCLHRLITNF